MMSLNVELIFSDSVLQNLRHLSKQTNGDSKVKWSYLKTLILPFHFNEIKIVTIISKKAKLKKTFYCGNTLLLLQKMRYYSRYTSQEYSNATHSVTGSDAVWSY